MEKFQLFITNVHLVFASSFLNMIKVKPYRVDILTDRQTCNGGQMSKILSYKDSRNNIVILVSLIASIIIANSFIVFSPDENSRSYFSDLTSTVTVGIPMVIAFIMVFRYKRSIKKQKQEDNSKAHLEHDTSVPSYYDNNKMHLSICIFLVLWFLAHIIWTFQFQQSSDISIQDVFWFIGYGFFGYFLYSLYYNFFRKEFEPFILILIAIIIVVVLVFVIDVITSTLRLVSGQTVDISVMLVTVAYPILDAMLIFPAVLIFWAVKRIGSKHIGEVDKVSSLAPVSSIWILLLSISMILTAIGDTGFAFSTAYGPNAVQSDVWVWDIFYNSSALCLAAALLGYKNFFSFKRIDTMQH